MLGIIKLCIKNRIRRNEAQSIVGAELLYKIAVGAAVNDALLDFE